MWFLPDFVNTHATPLLTQHTHATPLLTQHHGDATSVTCVMVVSVVSRGFAVTRIDFCTLTFRKCAAAIVSGILQYLHTCILATQKVNIFYVIYSCSFNKIFMLCGRLAITLCTNCCVGIYVRVKFVYSTYSYMTTVIRYTVLCYCICVTAFIPDRSIFVCMRIACTLTASAVHCICL